MKLEVRNHEVRSSNELPGLPYATANIFTRRVSPRDLFSLSLLSRAAKPHGA